MLGVQTWVATRRHSFTTAMGLGIASTVVSIMLLRSLKNIASTPTPPTASVCTWSLPYIVIARQATTALRDTALLIGIIGGLLITAVGCWQITHRDVP
jgi:hypothetical protein